jgi:prevent-host-death family protein
MDEISVRELRNHTADVVRRVEAGEELSLTVNRRPVADLVPHRSRSVWVPAATVRAILTEAPADRGLLTDVDDAVGQTIDEL